MSFVRDISLCDFPFGIYAEEAVGEEGMLAIVNRKIFTKRDQNSRGLALAPAPSSHMTLPARIENLRAKSSASIGRSGGSDSHVPIITHVQRESVLDLLIA